MARARLVDRDPDRRGDAGVVHRFPHCIHRDARHRAGARGCGVGFPGSRAGVAERGAGSMRILMVNSSADVTAGGTEKHVFELGDQLRRRGHEVSYLHAFPDRQGHTEPTGPRPSSTARTRRDDDVRRLLNHVDDFISRPSARLQRLSPPRRWISSTRISWSESHGNLGDVPGARPPRRAHAARLWTTVPAEVAAHASRRAVPALAFALRVSHAADEPLGSSGFARR